MVDLPLQLQLATLDLLDYFTHNNSVKKQTFFAKNPIEHDVTAVKGECCQRQCEPQHEHQLRSRFPMSLLLSAFHPLDPRENAAVGRPYVNNKSQFL